MDQRCVGVSGSRLRSNVTPTEPTVTVMKADSHLQVDPSTVYVIDAKSASDHLVRESTGGHYRRTAQELCVIRRSMQTLRARCSGRSTNATYDHIDNWSQPKNVERDRLDAVGCSHTIKADEVLCF